MAGAGFKTFGVGDVLTASDVNGYLMQQAVMNFADSGARGSAIGTATEGMVSYLQDTDAVEVYDGSAWVGVGASPAILQVVSTTKTDTFSATGTAYAAVTGLSATITPTSATSTVIVMYSMSAALTSSSNTAAFFAAPFRDGSNLLVPDSPGDRTPTVVTFNFYDLALLDTNGILPVSGHFYDSPSTTSAVTYDIRVRVGVGTVYVNRSATDSDTATFPRATSTITVMEVAA